MRTQQDTLSHACVTSARKKKRYFPKSRLSATLPALHRLYGLSKFFFRKQM